MTNQAACLQTAEMLVLKFHDYTIMASYILEVRTTFTQVVNLAVYYVICM